MKTPSTSALGILFFVFITTLIVSTAAAQDTPPRTVSDDQVNALANRMYCPVCPNETLDACQTQACVNWREEIRMMLESGASEQDVIDNFVARFGERVIGTPQDPLLRALALIFPVVIAAVGLIVGVITFTRWQNQRKRGDASAGLNNPPALSSDDVDYRRAIEDDLK